DPGIHAQSPEEIAGDILSVARVRLCLRPGSPNTERRIPGLERGQVRELDCVRAKVLVRLPGEQREIPIAILGVSAPVAAANFVSDPPQLLRLRDGKRLQHY